MRTICKAVTDPKTVSVPRAPQARIRIQILQIRGSCVECDKHYFACVFLYFCKLDNGAKASIYVVIS